MVLLIHVYAYIIIIIVVVVVVDLLSIIIVYNYHRWPAMLIFPFWQPVMIVIPLNYGRIYLLFHICGK